MASALKKFRMLEQQQQQDDDPATREPDPKPTKKNKLSMYSHIFSSFESSDTPDEIRRKTIEKVREEKRQAEIRKKEKLEDDQSCGRGGENGQDQSCRGRIFETGKGGR